MQYRQVSLIGGLVLLEINEVSKLYSSGWEFNNYIYFDPHKGFCFDDGRVIGADLNHALGTLLYLDYTPFHKFYVEN